MNLGRYKSVAQGEYYLSATYLKGPTSKNHFVVRPFSLKWFRSKGVRLEGATSLKSCFFSILFIQYFTTVSDCLSHR